MIFGKDKALLESQGLLHIIWFDTQPPRVGQFLISIRGKNYLTPLPPQTKSLYYQKGKKEKNSQKG